MDLTAWQGQQIFENAHGVALGLVEENGTFRKVNAEYCHVLERPREEIEGRLTFQEVTSLSDVRADVGLAKLVASGDLPRYSIDKDYVMPDSRTKAVWLGVSRILKDDGEGFDCFLAICIPKQRVDSGYVLHAMHAPPAMVQRDMYRWMRANWRWFVPVMTLGVAVSGSMLRGFWELLTWWLHARAGVTP